MPEGKKILVAVTGSIAAYKSAFLVRLLVQAGAEVKVVMSKDAINFITPLTLSTLSKNPVHSDFTENPDAGTWTNHVQLALWADLMIVAPLSANTLSKMATGQCDSFLLAVYMSAKCPVIVAPAMDHDMYIHPATSENLAKLKTFGHQILATHEGELASGLIGKGRMAEPEEIFEAVVSLFHPILPLKGKKVLMTAGPTYEMLDPVRFIGNFSSGKMGYAIAEELAARGANVHLVSGPTSQNIRHPNIKIENVKSADEMSAACSKHFSSADIAVLAAAVSDFKPKQKASSKIKKAVKVLSIELEETIDIAKTLGESKRYDQLIIGFALETDNELANAREKLRTKNFDMIVLNSMQDEGAGFGTDTNKITLLWPDNKTANFGLKPKKQVAKDIVTEIIKLTGK